MQVLIAEDDPMSRRLLEGTLSKWEYDVTSVADGQSAWEVLARPSARVQAAHSFRPSHRATPRP